MCHPDSPARTGLYDKLQRMFAKAKKKESTERRPEVARENTEVGSSGWGAKLLRTLTALLVHKSKASIGLAIHHTHL